MNIPISILFILILLTTACRKNSQELPPAPPEIGTLAADSLAIISIYKRNKASLEGIEGTPIALWEFVTIEDNRVTKITFSDKIVELPKEIGHLTALRSLMFPTNAIQSLPPEVGTLTDLRYLKMSRNALSSLPDEMAKLKLLDTVLLTHNSFSELPAVLLRLPKVSYIALDSNRITKIPSEISLFNSGTIRLNGNKLTELPEELYQCQKMRISLQDNLLSEATLSDTMIQWLDTKIPNWWTTQIGRNADDTTLWLNDSLALCAIVDANPGLSIDKRKKLTTWGDTLVEYSPYVKTLRGRALSLSVRSGRIRSLTIRAWNNSFTIPKELGNLRQLEHLDIYIDNAVAVPASIQNLKALKTVNIKSDHNVKVVLPDEIGECESLEVLRVFGLPWLPKSVIKLKNLDTLWIDRGHMVTLPEEIIGKRLRYFNVSDNALSPDFISSSLDEWLFELDSRWPLRQSGLKDDEIWIKRDLKADRSHVTKTFRAKERGASEKLSLECIYQFNPDNRGEFVITQFSISDSANRVLFTFEDTVTPWRTLPPYQYFVSKKVKVDGNNESGYTKNLIEMKDYNRDGYRDILIRDPRSWRKEFKQLYLYDESKKSYRWVHELNGLADPVFNSRDTLVIGCSYLSSDDSLPISRDTVALGSYLEKNSK